MTNQLEREGNVGQTMLGGPMTVAAKPVKNQQRGERAIELRVAAKLENLAVLRTLVGAVGTFEDLDFDAVFPSVREEVGPSLMLRTCTWFSTYRIHHRRAERFRDRPHRAAPVDTRQHDAQPRGIAQQAEQVGERNNALIGCDKRRRQDRSANI